MSENKPPRSPGRRIGSRNRISTALLESFAKDFEEHGPDVIKLVRLEEPATYLKLAFTLLPAEIEVKHDMVENWKGLMTWATQLPNLQARMALAIGSSETATPAESVESESKLSLPVLRSWAADARTSPSVTPKTEVATPMPPLRNEDFTIPPKELPQGPVKGFYLGDPNLPTTDGILDSDRAENTSGPGRVPGFGRRR